MHPFWKNVSRETVDKLHIYEDLLKKWQKSLNLVSDSTVKDTWSRHFLDSAQLFTYVKPHRSIACLGSGAGFPGAVLSIMGHDNVTLIERDQKKVVFLRTVSRETKTKITVINTDIVNCRDQFDCIISRALAPITTLLELSCHISKPETHYYFLKGDQLDQELSVASDLWEMTISKYNSISDHTGKICHLSNVRKI